MVCRREMDCCGEPVVADIKYAIEQCPQIMIKCSDRSRIRAGDELAKEAPEVKRAVTALLRIILCLGEFGMLRNPVAAHRNDAGSSEVSTCAVDRGATWQARDGMCMPVSLVMVAGRLERKCREGESLA